MKWCQLWWSPFFASPPRSALSDETGASTRFDYKIQLDIFGYLWLRKTMGFPYVDLWKFLWIWMNLLDEMLRVLHLAFPKHMGMAALSSLQTVLIIDARVSSFVPFENIFALEGLVARPSDAQLEKTCGAMEAAWELDPGLGYMKSLFHVF